jgi:hypothetical protein
VSDRRERERERERGREGEREIWKPKRVWWKFDAGERWKAVREGDNGDREKARKGRGA